jgi:hypothetical protein
MYVDGRTDDELVDLQVPHRVRGCCFLVGLGSIMFSVKDHDTFTETHHVKYFSGCLVAGPAVTIIGWRRTVADELYSWVREYPTLRIWICIVAPSRLPKHLLPYFDLRFALSSITGNLRTQRPVVWTWIIYSS